MLAKYTMRKSRGREEARLGQAAFTEHLPSKYIEMRWFYTQLTFFTCALPGQPSENLFDFFCTIYLRVREEPSRVTLRRDGALVAEDKASLGQRRTPCAAGQKRWIPEPESRAFPKTPDQRFLMRKRLAAAPGELPYRTERMAGSKETWVTNSPLMRKADPLAREKRRKRLMW